jgi:hypothetical protein
LNSNPISNMLITKAQMARKIETARCDVNQAMRIRGKVGEIRTQRIVLSVYAACVLLLWAGAIAGTIHLLRTLSPVLPRPNYVHPEVASVGPGVQLEAGIGRQDLDGGLSLSMDIDVHQLGFPSEPGGFTALY